MDDLSFVRRAQLARQVTRRSSPSFLTAAWFPELFWDGRARGAFVDPATSATVIPLPSKPGMPARSGRRPAPGAKARPCNSPAESEAG